MSNIKKVEEQAYEAVLRGELEIDDQGRIWRVGKRVWNFHRKQVQTIACERVRAEHRLPLGYLQIRAMVNKVRYNALAHRLIWFHLYGSIPDGLTINHMNGIRDDNRPNNLETATLSQQQIHSVHVLKSSRISHQDGEMNTEAKLTETNVREIRRLRAEGILLRVIGDQFGVSYKTISKIALRQLWAHVE